MNDQSESAGTSSHSIAASTVFDYIQMRSYVLKANIVAVAGRVQPARARGAVCTPVDQW